MDQSEVKVMIGEALNRAYSLDNAENTIPTLRRLLQESQKTELETAVIDFLESSLCQLCWLWHQ